jgi:glycogen operon protein
MCEDMWNADLVRSIGMVLAGDAIEDVNERGEPIIGDTLLILLSADADDIPFALPPVEGARLWQRVFDTSEPDASERGFKAGTRYPLQGRSVAAFKLAPPLRERRRTAHITEVAALEPTAVEA